MNNDIVSNNKLIQTEIKVGMNLNEKLIVTKRKKECRPSFWMVNKGDWRSCMKNVKQFNTLKIISEFNDTEGFAFRIILDNLIPAQSLNGELYTTCNFSIDRKEMNSIEKVKLSKGLSMLIKKDLLVKTGRSSYMINLLFILPQYQEVEYNEYIRYKSKKNKLKDTGSN